MKCAFLTVNNWHLKQNISFQSLSTHLAEKHVQYYPVSSPPVLWADQCNDTEGLNY